MVYKIPLFPKHGNPAGALEKQIPEKTAFIGPLLRRGGRRKNDIRLFLGGLELLGELVERLR